VPGVEALLPRFRAAHTQVLGVSIDSIHSHASWGRDLGGVSFPLLADFQPKGAMAQSYGVYLEDAGITDRATVLVDSGGTVRHASSVTPAGQRDIAELAALCERVDREGSTATRPLPEPRGLGSDAVLFVRSHCGFSRRARVAVANLHAANLVVRNASEEAGALDALRGVSGAEAAPCLVIDRQCVSEADVIVRKLAERLAPVR
jgi:hypothetical protein